MLVVALLAIFGEIGQNFQRSMEKRSFVFIDIFIDIRNIYRNILNQKSCIFITIFIKGKRISTSVKEYHEGLILFFSCTDRQHTDEQALITYTVKINDIISAHKFLYAMSFNQAIAQEFTTMNNMHKQQNHDVASDVTFILCLN